MIRLGFRFRLLLAAVLPAMLLASVLVAMSVYWTRTVLESALRQRVEAMASQLATSAEFQLFSGDIATMRALVDSLAQGKNDVVGISIIDQTGNVWVRRGVDTAVTGLSDVPTWSSGQHGKDMQLVFPIAVTQLVIDDIGLASAGGGRGARPLGHVVLAVSLDSLNRERNRMLMMSLLALAVAVLTGGGLAFLLARSVTDPIGRLITMVERIGRGELHARADLGYNNVLYPLVRGINEMAENVAMTQEELQSRIEVATRELTTQKHAAEREARIDPLTGLNNRRAFLEHAEREVCRASRYSSSIALIMLDIDHFKVINDSHGHPVGDRVLVDLSAVLLESMREVDIVGRLGGEEFAILMPDTDLDAATQAAERLRQEIMAMRVVLDGPDVIHCTASLGVSSFLHGGGSIHDLLVRADRALYRAKQMGRNRVEWIDHQG